jgi:hypothetical protein
MNQIRVRAFEQEYGDWSAHFRSWNNGSLIYKNIEVVLDDSYTHALVYNLTKPPLTIPKENVIGFITEPYDTYNLNATVEYARKHIGTYFCHDNTHLDKSIFKNGMPFLGPMCGTMQMTPPRIKQNTMSMVASNKNYFRGHQLRHEIIRKILNSNLEIDIYGRGLEHIYRDRRIKGSLEDKNVAFHDYKFTIAIENCSYPTWVTEKYYDPIMKSCIPIYWGASEINNLYSPNSHVYIPHDANIDQIMDIISRTYHSHHSYGFHNIEEGQKIIQEKQNLQEFVWRHFNGIR